MSQAPPLLTLGVNATNKTTFRMQGPNQFSKQTSDAGCQLNPELTDAHPKTAFWPIC